MLDIFQSKALRIPQKQLAGFARNSSKPLETYIFLETRISTPKGWGAFGEQNMIGEKHGCKD
jgi:hypothetical protein